MEKMPMYVSVKEFVEKSGLTEYCVRKLLRIDEFPKLKLGHSIKIPLAAAQEWLLDRQEINLDCPVCYK